MTKKWKWLGKNEFIPGVPARDLDDEELDQRGIRNIVENSKLFEEVKQKSSKEKVENGS